MPKLIDSWFEATFIRSSPNGGHSYVDTLDGADGILLWCPCGHGKAEYPLDGARPHAIIVSFANPKNAPPAPDSAVSRSRAGIPTRWLMNGTNLADLTLSPSIDVGTPSCWHGFITNGEIR